MALTVTLYVFGVSLCAIVLLFAFKAFEVRRAAATRAAWRDSADEFALRVKWMILVVEWYVARTPLFLTLLARWIVHMSALWFAGLAHGLANHAHRLADFVSHKRSFERRETRNQFLKQVSAREGGAPAAPTSPLIALETSLDVESAPTLKTESSAPRESAPLESINVDAVQSEKKGRRKRRQK